MTVKDQCLELQERLLKHAAVDATKASVEKMEARRSELEEERFRLAAIAASTEVLLSTGHLAGSTLPDCSKALESCDKVGAILAEASAADRLTKGQDYRYLLVRVEKVRKRLSDLNERAWRSVLDKHRLVDEAFLKKVEAVPGQHQAVRRIRDLESRYREASGLPRSEGDYQRFEKAYTTYQDEISSLDPKSFPDEVLLFFRAAVLDSGAPLSLFTESVRTWLDENGFLDGIRVRFTGSGST